MSSDIRPPGGWRILDLIYQYREQWIKFIEGLIGVAIFQSAAQLSHSAAAYGLWFVSMVVLLVWLVRVIVELFKGAFDRLPWDWIETLPRLVSYPIVCVLGLTVAFALLLVGDYSTFRLCSVIEVIAKSHVAPH